MAKTFLTVGEAAARLRHSRAWLYQHIDQIPTVILGGKRLVPEDALDQLIDDLAAGRVTIS